MDESIIKAEIKKAIALQFEGVFTLDDLEARMFQIFKENDSSARHKEQLERMIYQAEKMMDAQQKYFKHKNNMGECKSLEADLRKKINHLKTAGGYSIERFYTTSEQKRIF